jgi:hypothetical protein
VQTGVERRQRHGRVARGRRADEHRVEPAGLEQVLPARVRATNAVAAGDQRPRTGVRLGEDDDVEAVGEQRKLGQVRDLGDQARPDDPQPKPSPARDWITRSPRRSTIECVPRSGELPAKGHVLVLNRAPGE